MSAECTVRHVRQTPSKSLKTLVVLYGSKLRRHPMDGWGLEVVGSRDPESTGFVATRGLMSRVVAACLPAVSLPRCNKNHLVTITYGAFLTSFHRKRNLILLLKEFL
jgi:hypothetical protein